MDEIERYVTTQNIERFVDRLRVETDPARRASLNRLLVEHENRFSVTDERLQLVNRHLSDGTQRIEKQKRLVADLKSNGHESDLAEELLGSLEATQLIFYNYRSTLLVSLDRRSP